MHSIVESTLCSRTRGTFSAPTHRFFKIHTGFFAGGWRLHEVYKADGMRSTPVPGVWGLSPPPPPPPPPPPKWLPYSKSGSYQTCVQNHHNSPFSVFHSVLLYVLRSCNGLLCKPKSKYFLLPFLPSLPPHLPPLRPHLRWLKCTEN